ncbi:tyrosine-type recombinase/integrase, partial [archaeon]|nr:tyrosine-type recombinase/integrase [archaeon]
MKEDLHRYKEKIEMARMGLLNDPKVSPKNKELITKFEKQILLEGLSDARICKYFYILKMIAKKIEKDFDQLKREDIEDFILKLHASSLSIWTKQSYKEMLRRFFQWLKNCDRRTYPEEVSWISTRVDKKHKNMPNEGDLLNEEDVKSMIEHCKNLRDRAFLSVLWESGARVGEVGTLRIKDIFFDKYGAQIYLDGKTGPRKIRLISSVPHLSQWLSVHEAKNDRDSRVWVCLVNGGIEPITYTTIRKMLKKISKRAGIKKRVNPHSFRHARATYLANHLTEFQMNQYFGWVQGSGMPSTYVHLTGKNTDDALLRLNGVIKIEDKKPSLLQP